MSQTERRGATPICVVGELCDFPLCFHLVLMAVFSGRELFVHQLFIEHLPCAKRCGHRFPKDTNTEALKTGSFLCGWKNQGMKPKPKSSFGPQNEGGSAMHTVLFL